MTSYRAFGVFFLSLLLSLPLKAQESIGFYYGPVDSVRELASYSRVVLEPKQVSNRQIAKLKQAQTRVFAYLSVGELAGQRVPEALRDSVLTVNPHWRSKVMDLQSAAWQAHLVNQAKALKDSGFDGLFLDTLDSYQLGDKDKTKQQAALLNIIAGLYQVFTKESAASGLILNRGFELIDTIKHPVYAVAAESLYAGFTPSKTGYFAINAQDRQWLLNKLHEVTARGIEAIAIDYVEPNNTDKQREVAAKIIQHGITPYVSDGYLNTFGQSTLKPIARRVLGFYDAQKTPLRDASCHRFFSLSIEFEGYVPQCLDIHSTDFDTLDPYRYAGIQLDLEPSLYQRYPKLGLWLASLVDQVPLVFLRNLPPDEALLKRLGLRRGLLLSGKLELAQGQRLLNKYQPRLSAFEQHQQWLINDANAEVLVAYRDASGKALPLLAKTTWGGFALAPLPVMNLANKQDKWLIDPFIIPEKLLALDKIPAPDVTTESGRRIMTAHIDGDGFASRSTFPNRDYVSKVIYDKVLKRYKIPNTVSVVEGETARTGLYPKQSAALEKIAKDIFRLKHVEAASHSFSHPFFWDKRRDFKVKQYGDHLAIKGYKLDFEREILGSVNYINKQLLPNKKRVKVMLWSGLADPLVEHIELAEQADLFNVNGGNTFVIQGKENLAQVSPTILQRNETTQVYAPVQNENLYTNLWTNQFDGYGRVIDTFRILETPRRLKPISLYYHMYSGTYPASVGSLQRAYEWGIKQEVTHLYLSEYAQRASALYDVALAQDLSGTWHYASPMVRTLRLNNTLDLPLMTQSDIAGWRKVNHSHYVSLSQTRGKLRLQTNDDTQLRLLDANAQIKTWEKNQNGVAFTLLAHTPLKMRWLNAKGCKIKLNKQKNPVELALENKVGVLHVRSNQRGMMSGVVHCPHR